MEALERGRSLKATASQLGIPTIGLTAAQIQERIDTARLQQASSSSEDGGLPTSGGAEGSRGTDVKVFPANGNVCVYGWLMCPVVYTA